MNLRAHLEALAAGNGPKPRGNVLLHEHVAAHSEIAGRLGIMFRSSVVNHLNGREEATPINCPGTLLPPLP
ncbi:MAG TPA: hypothetical protein VN667_09835 [Burkholderiales bacterium]|nr:hypothetical protein [Burkholderiales bacterium]